MGTIYKQEKVFKLVRTAQLLYMGGRENKSSGLVLYLLRVSSLLLKA